MKIRQKTIKKDKVNTDGWGEWQCNPSTFDWEYDEEETAYVFEGKILVKTPADEVKIKGGQLAQFPKGLKCTWTVLEPIKKVFTFQKFDWDD